MMPTNDNSSKKIIAVIGSTGMQGGGLVQAMLKDNDKSPFQVRALTRNPDKESAVALREAGADVVAFDMDGRVEEMAKALVGVHGLFVVTNYWEHFDQDRESKQAQAVIEAGEMAGVKHYVWSTLEDTSPFFDSLPEAQRPQKINGMYVPFFDVKEQTNKHFPKEKSTMLYTSAYLQDLYNYGWIKEGTFVANLENAKLPVIAAEDIGKATYGIFKAGDEYLGKTVHLATDRLTGHELMAIASEVLGKPFGFQNVTHKTYVDKEALISRLIGNMLEYMRLNPKYSAALDPAEANDLTNGGLVSVRAFFEAHKKEMLAVGPKEIEV